MLQELMFLVLVCTLICAVMTIIGCISYFIIMHYEDKHILQTKKCKKERNSNRKYEKNREDIIRNLNELHTKQDLEDLAHNEFLNLTMKGA